MPRPRFAPFVVFVMLTAVPASTRAGTSSSSTDRAPSARVVGLSAGQGLRAQGRVTPASLVRSTLRAQLTPSLELAPRGSRVVGGTAIRVEEVRGTLGGIPLHEGVARVLVVDGVPRLLTHNRPVPALDAASKANLTASQAIARLEATAWPGSKGATTATLVVVPETHASRLYWRIDPPADVRHHTNPVFFVDATTGEPSLAYDRARFADVRTFRSNPTSTPTAIVETLQHLDAGAKRLEGPYFRAVTCFDPLDPDKPMCSERALAQADAQGDFLYPAPDVTIAAQNTDPRDPFAEVSAYYHSDKFLAWLLGHGFPGLVCNEKGGIATLFANARDFSTGSNEPFDNAQYLGDCEATMLLGQGTSVDYGYDGDVIYHELGHGVVERLATGLSGRLTREEAAVVDAAGLNEGIADSLSSIFAQDPVMGDYVAAHSDRFNEAGIRILEHDYVCPDDITGKVHLDGLIFAGAVWEAYLAHKEAIVPAILDMLAMLPSESSFEEASAILVSVTEARLGAAAGQAMHDRLDKRGLLDCTRITSWMNVDRPLHLDANARWQPFVPPPLQLEATIPKGARTMSLSLKAAPRDPGFGELPEIDAKLIYKFDAAMTFSAQEGRRSVLIESDHDGIIDGIEDGTVTLDVTGKMKVYFGFLNEGEGTMTVDDLAVSFDVEGAVPDAPDTGGGPSTGSGSDTAGSGSTGDGAQTDGSTDDRAGGEPGLSGGTDTAGDTDGGAKQADDAGCACHAVPGGPGAAASWAMVVLALARPMRRRR